MILSLNLSSLPPLGGRGVGRFEATKKSAPFGALCFYPPTVPLRRRMRGLGWGYSVPDLCEERSVALVQFLGSRCGGSRHVPGSLIPGSGREAPAQIWA